MLGRLSGEAVFLARRSSCSGSPSPSWRCTAAHNGWLYYQGGDQTFFYTTAWIARPRPPARPGSATPGRSSKRRSRRSPGRASSPHFRGIVAIQVVPALATRGSSRSTGSAKRLARRRHGPTGTRRLGRGPVSRSSRFRRPLPRPVGRPDAASAARPHGHGRLRLDGDRPLSPPTCSFATSTREDGRRPRSPGSSPVSRSG